MSRAIPPRGLGREIGFVFTNWLCLVKTPCHKPALPAVEWPTARTRCRWSVETMYVIKLFQINIYDSLSFSSRLGRRPACPNAPATRPAARMGLFANITSRRIRPGRHAGPADTEAWRPPSRHATPAFRLHRGCGGQARRAEIACPADSCRTEASSTRQCLRRPPNGPQGPSEALTGPSEGRQSLSAPPERRLGPRGANRVESPPLGPQSAVWQAFPCLRAGLGLSSGQPPP